MRLALVIAAGLFGWAAVVRAQARKIHAIADLAQVEAAIDMMEADLDEGRPAKPTIH